MADVADPDSEEPARERSRAYAARKRRHRQRKRAMGLCAYDGCRNESPDYYLCDWHRAGFRVRQRERREREAQA